MDISNMSPEAKDREIVAFRKIFKDVSDDIGLGEVDEALICYDGDPYKPYGDIVFAALKVLWNYIAYTDGVL